jgi:prepilin-type N-terminal cleavage/methylation domain-containing protein
MNSRNRTARNRGYSLIEVLIATTVLGLGTLGLIAIIAGSASQQHSSSMQNLSVGVVKNADGLLSRVLGRPGQTTTGIPEGQWTNVIMDETSNYLTVAPGYLLVPELSDTVVYTSPADAFNQSNVSPGAIAPFLTQGFYSGGSSMFFGQPMTRLRQRRVDLESGLTVVIEVRHFDGVNTIDDSEMLTFVSPTTVPNSGDIIDIPFSSSTNGILFTGLPPLQFDRREHLFRGTAGIHAFNIPLPMNWFINSITVLPYEWRNDQLVSLSDRFVTEPEPAYPGGERPILGYSALIRQADASTQLCFFTYSLRPLSQPTANDATEFKGLAFVPPDTVDEVNLDQGVLREVKLDLGYEASTQRYYFQIPATATMQEELGWAIAQGQILMVSSKNGVVNNGFDPNDPGADFPVKVLVNRSLTRPDGDEVIVGYLDRSPRIDGRTPIPDLSSDTPEEVYAWAVQPVVKSRTDGTEWLLSVIEARLIQVVDQ